MINTQEDNFLGSVMDESISIQDWLKKMSINFPKECSYLLDNGKDYIDIYQKHPEDLPGPKFCEKDQCHRNTMLYLLQIKGSNQKLAEHVYYVTGFAKASSAVKVVNPGLLHIITRHSFLVYKDHVYDMTYLNYPPTYYKVEQYFGVSFHSGLMDIPWDFESKRGYSLGVMDFVIQEGGPFILK